MMLPATLPDESLFSRICRFLAKAGLTRSECLNNLLGNKRASVHPWLTANLSTLSQYSEESAHELWLNQTLRPLFAYYLIEHQSKIRDLNAGASELTRACQLSAFRERELLSIKYCPICAKDDIYNYGVSYWHCIHQIPGVVACAKHSVFLIHRDMPDRVHLSNHFLPLPSGNFERSNSLATEFARYSEYFINEIKACGTKYVSDEYRSKLKECDLTTQAGRIRRRKLVGDIYAIACRILPKDSQLAPKSREDFHYLSPLLSDIFGQHPFKHLLLSFYLSRQDTSHRWSGNTISQTFPDLEQRCCHLLKAQLSMAQVGREIGKSRCYVKSVALRHHIPVHLNPKKITASVKKGIIEMAYKGFHRDVIAKKFGVSTGSIELVISTTEGLVEWRKKCKAESLRRKYKCQITRYIQANPDAFRKDIKLRYEAAFYWLYSHCPDWLEAKLPTPQKVLRAERVNWEQRDIDLSEKVLALMSNSNTVFSRSELERMLNARGWLTSKKHKLPKTMYLISAQESPEKE